jgi:hypothetical protein
MIITVVNMSGKISDAQLHPTIRAINRQIREDFEPYWSLGATLRLEGKTGADKPDKLGLPEMRGDAVLYCGTRPTFRTRWATTRAMARACRSASSSPSWWTSWARR